MEILTILATGTLCIVCFFIGAKVGQKVSKGETIETPTLNPAKVIREHQHRKAEDKENRRTDAILRNLERYDGTGIGQEDVPPRG